MLYCKSPHILTKLVSIKIQKIVFINFKFYRKTLKKVSHMILRHIGFRLKIFTGVLSLKTEERLFIC